MQITINKKKFIDALSIGGAMARKAKTMPILEFTKITVAQDSLTLYSFDMECGVTKSVPAICVGEGEFAVNAGEFIKVLKALVEEEVTLFVDNTTLSIDHIKGSISMPIMDASTFPTISLGSGDTKTLAIDTNKLQEWISVATNFAAADDLRPVMCGMYLYAKEGKMGICATDAHKLYTDSIDYEGDELSIVIPSRAFKPLLTLMANHDNVSAIVDSRNITFETSDAKLCCRLVEGNYPNFKAVIPQGNNVKVEVSKAELYDSINRASLMADTSTSLLKLNVEDDAMTIEGKDIDFSKSAKDKVAITKSGNDVTIGVKSSFFSICLSSLDCEDVVIRFGDSTKPIVFEDSTNPNKVVLVMPMMIN